MATKKGVAKKPSPANKDMPMHGMPMTPGKKMSMPMKGKK